MGGGTRRKTFTVASLALNLIPSRKSTHTQTRGKLIKRKRSFGGGSRRRLTYPCYGKNFSIWEIKLLVIPLNVSTSLVLCVRARVSFIPHNAPHFMFILFNRCFFLSLLYFLSIALHRGMLAQYYG